MMPRRALVHLAVAAAIVGGTTAFTAQKIAAQNIAAQDSAATDAPRAARALARGTVLAPEHFENSPEGVAPDGAPVGWITRRVIRAGEPLRPPAISRRPLIASGDSVGAHAVVGPVTVIRPATALTHGLEGDTLRVRLHRGPARLAVVLDPRTVRLLPSPDRP